MLVHSTLSPAWMMTANGVKRSAWGTITIGATRGVVAACAFPKASPKPSRRPEAGMPNETRRRIVMCVLHSAPTVGSEGQLDTPRARREGTVGHAIAVQTRCHD